MDNKKDRNDRFTFGHQEEDKLVRNKVEMHNKSPRDYINVIGNGRLIDIRDSDCEMAVTTIQHSPSKRKYGPKKQNRSSDDRNNQLLVESRMSHSSSDPCKREKLKNKQKVEDNINEYFTDENGIEGSELKSGKSKRGIRIQNEKEKKSKTESQHKAKKKTTDSEKSFIETLMEYYQAQSNLESEDEDHSHNVSIAKYKTKNCERKRRNSGDCINVSSSEENSFVKQNHDQTLKKKNKKGTLAHNIQQREFSVDFSIDGLYSGNDICSKYSVKTELLTPKKKEGTAKSNGKEDNSMTHMPDKDKSENVKIRNRKESFSVGCNDREDLGNPEKEEYERKKLKRKKHKSKHRGSAESEISSLCHVTITEDSVTRVTKESFKQVPEANSENIGSAHDIKQLEVESSGSELVEYSPSKMKEQVNNNSIHCFSSSEKPENSMTVEILSPEKVIPEKQCITSNGDEISYYRESNDENELEYQANKGKGNGNHIRLNDIGDEKSKNESVNDTGESAPNLKLRSSEKRKRKKKNNSLKDITLIDEQESEENSYIKSKIKKNKKRTEISSLEKNSIVDMRPKLKKMISDSPKPDSSEGSSKRTKKNQKNLNSYEECLEKSPKQMIINNILEQNCGLNTSQNEMDGHMERIENPNKKFRSSIDDSKSNIENYETALSIHEFDETVKEEIDISFNDLKEFNITDSIINYSTKEIRTGNSGDEDPLQDASIAKYKTKNCERKRRNSGDSISVFSSEENSFEKQNHDQTLKKKNKKRTLAHSIQQREFSVDILIDGRNSGDDNCSEYSVIKTELLTPKKKKGTAKSNSNEDNSMTDMPDKDETENVKIRNRNESFSIGCYSREDSSDPEKREYARKKLKRKKHESQHRRSIESEISSLCHVSTTEDSVTRVIKESFKQVTEANSENIGSAHDIKQLEVESSGSELDINYSPSTLKKHINNNSIHCLSSSEKPGNGMKVEISSPEKVIPAKQCIISNGDEISVSQESNDKNELEYQANKGKGNENHIRLNYVGDEESKNESVNDTGESAPNLKIRSSEKRKRKEKDNSVKDITLIDELEPEENSYIKSKIKKNKKRTEISSLENLYILDMRLKPKKMISDSPKPDSSEGSSKLTKKNLKNLNSYDECLEKSPKHMIINNSLEQNCGLRTSQNEIDGDMKRIENPKKKFRSSIDDSKSNIENYETALLIHEFDETVNEETDISFNDLKDFNITDSIINDSSEEIRTGNIKKINEYIEENLEMEDYGAEILKKLRISIPFAIPPLHLHLRRPSKPSEEEINARKDLKMKLGAFSKEEDQTIINNWRRFCREHRLNIEPTAFFKFPPKMPKEQKIKFMQYISHGLETRSPHRVYFRFKTLFGNLVKKTGRFTEEEDNQILEYMEEMGSSKTPFTDLGKILNRPSNSIARHFKHIQHEEKLMWTPRKAEELIIRMLKVTKLENVEQLKDSKLTAKQWRKVSRKLGGISVIKLQRAWNITIYPRLFATEDLILTKKQIIDILHKRQETDWRRVNWKKIAKKFPGYSPEKLYMMFKKLVIFNVPKNLQKDIRKCVEYLREKKIARPHRFRRYVYKNGHLAYESDGDEDDHSDRKLLDLTVHS